MSAGEAGRRWGTVIVWFRRDLRIHDHPALVDAVRSAGRVVPLFVLDPRLLDGRWAATARTWYLVGCLRDLDTQLEGIGARLVVRTGDPVEVLPRLAREFGADAVLVSRDVTPYARRRDRRVAVALEADGRSFHTRRGVLLVEPEAIATRSGTPFTVFSPFWRAIRSADRRAILPAPTQVPMPDGIDPGTIPAASGPGMELPQPGASAARSRLERWLTHGLRGYHEGREWLSGAGTSHLGADLHLGTLSVGEVEDRATAVPGPGSEAWRRQLAWREFYHHLLWHRPELLTSSFHPRLARALRPASADPAGLDAWQTGRTGVPAVDAGMRQLLATGWMSNRARLIAASFLTRHLLLDHRAGEAHFMRHLVDGDVADNGGGWQWTAGVGTDAQPWFRIFDPVRQGQRFDPDGSWIRRWVPELVDVADRDVHAPWLAPGGPPAGYPAPIIDLRFGRERALAAFKAAAQTG